MVECVRVRHSSMDSPVFRREEPHPHRLRHMRRTENPHSFLRLGRLASSCSFFVSVFVFLGFLLAVASGYPQAPAVGESVVPRLIDDDAGMASANALDTPSAGVTYPSRASEATRGQDAQILYIPFFMAESLPASMNTRDPAIISVSGCPRGHYRSHTGNCRKNFHYTINPLIHNSYNSRHSRDEAKVLIKSSDKRTRPGRQASLP
ncbi:uncharacterized protein LOC143036472 isoform X2 [Oratosquilla oratoria]|uniref:uncharacterized protein LOC143036472 isoform X2 n=1 Tax=Oratosquilla oratoria TaxID=337810 RepID=UPI003F758CC0